MPSLGLPEKLLILLLTAAKCLFGVILLAGAIAAIVHLVLHLQKD